MTERADTRGEQMLPASDGVLPNDAQLIAVDGSAWVTQTKRAELFQPSTQAMTQHMAPIYSAEDKYFAAIERPERTAKQSTTTWATARLSDVAKIQTGGTPSRADPMNWAQGTIPWITTSEVNGGRIREAKQHITAKGLATSSAKIVPAGAVLVAMIGQGRTRGQVALLELPAATNQNSAALIPSAKIESEFLHQYLKFRYVAVRALSNSSGQGNLNASLIGGFHVPVPPLPEQRKIAEILRTWDDAIELVEAHVSKLQMRRSWIRMTVLTGRVRIGDHAGPWSRTPLSGVLREHKKRSSGSEEVFSVSVHKGLVNQKEHLGRSFAAANTDNYNLVESGDIVYTKSPTGDFPLGIIKRSSVPGAVIVSPLYGVFTPQNPDLGVILDAYFESPRTVQNYLSPLVQKGAKNTIAITNQGFLSGHLNLPGSPAEQRELAELLTASREEIMAAQRKAALLRTQKRGLMQKLLTGQVRVNVSAETHPGGHEDD